VNKSWLYILIAVLVIVAGFSAYQAGRFLRPKVVQEDTKLSGTAWQNPPSVANVTLKKADGETIILGDLQGDINVIFFGFTRCPDVCPLTMAKLAQIYRDLQEPKNLKVAMITVDPEFDTPKVTQSYISNFHPDFIGLSGSNTQIANAIQSFYIASQKSGEAQFVHTDAIIILDKQAHLRYVYGQNSLIDLAGDLKQLLSTKDW
jgi:protein SCO1